MTHFKEIEHNYKPGDVVYVVNRYMVEKVVIESITVKITENQTFTNYNVYNYRDKNKADRKVVAVGQAYLVDNLVTAISSARINNDQTYNAVKEALGKISEKNFEPTDVAQERINEPNN